MGGPFRAVRWRSGTGFGIVSQTQSHIDTGAIIGHSWVQDAPWILDWIGIDKRVLRPALAGGPSNEGRGEGA